MPEENTPLNEREKLEAENDFLKMKLMLERNAHFDICSKGDIPPTIENEFLRNIIEFEKQFESRRTIKIFDRIGRPGHFSPVKDITDDQIKVAWEKLDKFLLGHGIDLDAISPNVTDRELYRFATEELFNHEIDDINIPGMMVGFIYDEFYPDHAYDNTRLAIDDCMEYIFQKKPMEYFHWFRKVQLRFNDHYPLTIQQLKEKINLFKEAYEDLEIKEIEATGCVIEQDDCFVSGRYSILAATRIDLYPLSGNWKINFKRDEKFGFWDIAGLEITGINF